ncbi:hypothetical protein SFRURICE_008838 [Spodoptera frugiperda]|uniref:SFRICE_001137 n=1 Tax=Spodoptera frugiperda TaxID=7108 RepID=A0A2H1VFR2_SPOFR|nr:hypothetical protein SFRURICE_008838 [Spodoptera frugiperda]
MLKLVNKRHGGDICRIPRHLRLWPSLAAVTCCDVGCFTDAGGGRQWRASLQLPTESREPIADLIKHYCCRWPEAVLAQDFLSHGASFNKKYEIECPSATKPNKLAKFANTYNKQNGKFSPSVIQGVRFKVWIRMEKNVKKVLSYSYPLNKSNCMHAVLHASLKLVFITLLDDLRSIASAPVLVRVADVWISRQPGISMTSREGGSTPWGGSDRDAGRGGAAGAGVARASERAARTWR